VADINLKANLNRSDVTMGLQELTSQLGMALGQATGFGTAATQMAGSPNMLGGAFGSTFTDARMAYSPHYGSVHAATTMAQEQAVQQRGLAAAQQLKPPGVAPAAFAMAAMTNSIERDAAARDQASSAARAAFYTSAGGLAGGAAAAMAGGWAGAKVGAAMGARFFGAGGAAAGAAIGGLAGNWFGFDAGMDFTGGKIENHFARVEQIGGVTKELGEIAGGGRGMGREGRYGLGIAARKAAGDLNMDVQQMGDILAVGREAGMMPSSKDPGKAREQYRDYARAIEEGAQVLQSSLASATQVIKQATSQGMSSTEGISRAAGAGGADAWLQQQSRMNAFGNAGAAAGRGMGFTGAQGRGVYMGGLSANSGLSGEEQKIMGGKFGVGGFVGQAQMAMAASPAGDMQLMAAMGGQGGASMMDMPGAALAGLTANGDDLMTGMMNFTVNKDSYRRGIGTKGVQAMARQQMSAGADMLESMGMGGTAKTRQAFFAMNQMGLSGLQARTLVGGSGRGGGGGGGGGRGNMSANQVAKMAMARQATDLGGTGVLSDAEIQAQVDSAPQFGIDFGEAAMAGAAGALFASPTGPGAVVAGVGWAAADVAMQNFGALKNLVMGDGPGLFASAPVKADYYQQKSNRKVDAKVRAAEKSMGFVRTDEDEITDALSTNLTGIGMDLDAEGSPKASAMTHAALTAAGLKTVDPNSKGAIKVGGDYFNNREVQKLALSNPGITKKQRELGREGALKSLMSKEVGRVAAIERRTPLEEAGWIAAASGKDRTFDAIDSSEKAREGIIEAVAAMKAGDDPKIAAGNYQRLVQRQIGLGGKELQAAVKEEGLGGNTAIAFVSALTNQSAEGLSATIKSVSARGLGAGFAGAKEENAGRLAGFLDDQYSGEVTSERTKSERGAIKGQMMGQLYKRQGIIYDYEKADAAVDKFLADPEGGDADFSVPAGWGGDEKSVSLSDLYAPISEKMAAKKSAGQSAKDEGSLFTRKVGAQISARLGHRMRGAIENPSLREGVQKDVDRIWGDALLAGTEADRAKYSKAPDFFKERERGGQDFIAKFDMRDKANQPGAFSMVPEEGAGTGQGIASVLEDAKKAVLGYFMTTPAAEFAEQSKVEDSDIETGKPKKRRRRNRGLQNAAGFGASESAMATINKSLRHTERMFKITAKQIAGKQDKK